MKQVLFILMSLWCLQPDTAKAQKPKEVEVHDTATYVVGDNQDITLYQAKQRCIAKAKIAALKAAFGAKVEFDIIVIDHDKNGEISSDSWQKTFESIRGHWRDTKKPVISVSYENDILTFKAEVWGKATEIVKPETNLKWTVLNAEKKETTELQSEERYYVRLCSPAEGYVAIFMEDGKGTVSYLYPKETGDAYHIKKDKEYTFFDEKKNFFVTKEEVEHIDIILVYSKKPFTKPILDKNKNKFAAGKLSAKDFEDWLRRPHAADLEKKSKPLELKKKKQ